MEKEGLIRHVEDIEEAGFDDHYEHETCCSTYNRKSDSKLLKAFGILLLSSLSLNAFLSYRVCRISPSLINTPPDQKPSAFAGLLRNHPDTYYKETPYTSSNTTLSDALWHDINIDSGVVALDDAYAEDKGLPRSQRFPWDQSKGIYILHGFHNLHCLKILSLSLHEYRLSLPQTRSHHHILHCFDALRRQILCDADDTPRATSLSYPGVSGAGQIQMCKSWEKMEEWAKEHTACYRRPETPREGGDIAERFRWCPEGSGYEVLDAPSTD